MSRSFIPILQALCLCLFWQACSVSTSGTFEVLEIENEASVNSQSANLSLADDGTVYLSWMEKEDSSHWSFRAQRLERGSESFGPAYDLAVGEDWFVNWADLPGMIAAEKEREFSWHLAKSSPETFDYDVMLHNSAEPESFKKLNDDEKNAEHGFVSALSYEGGALFVWLDGRNTFKPDPDEKMGDHGHDGHGMGAMSLRSAFVNSEFEISPSVEIDDRICDCCQTDMALSDCGPVVVYRDRTEGEIRDISFSRMEGGHWTRPRPVFEDKWFMPACPVNGPAIDAIGNTVVVAWYTAADDSVRVNFSWSRDCGNNFDLPMVISRDSTMGRLDLKLLNQEEAMLVWMYRRGDESVLSYSLINLKSRELKNIDLLTNQLSRRSGFPRITRQDDRVILAYTRVNEDNSTRVETIILRP